MKYIYSDTVEKTFDRLFNMLTEDEKKDVPQEVIDLSRNKNCGIYNEFSIFYIKQIIGVNEEERCSTKECALIYIKSKNFSTTKTST